MHLCRVGELPSPDQEGALSSWRPHSRQKRTTAKCRVHRIQIQDNASVLIGSGTELGISRHSAFCLLCRARHNRHSFATWLMHQGVGIKAIGDALGHRGIASTSVYLRLNVDELRQVALPAPAAPAGGRQNRSAPERAFLASGPRVLSTNFRHTFRVVSQRHRGDSWSLSKAWGAFTGPRSRCRATGTSSSTATTRGLPRYAPRCLPAGLKPWVV